MIDIVSQIEDKADDLGYRFSYGRADFINYEVQNIRLDSGEYHMVLFPVTQNGVTTNNKAISRYRCPIILALGRKFDTNSMGVAASLDETEKQKYDRRLYTLSTLMETFIESLVCNSTLELVNPSFSFDINVYDTNIDYCILTCTIEYDNS